jgi:hypothetical protein
LHTVADSSSCSWHGNDQFVFNTFGKQILYVVQSSRCHACRMLSGYSC